MLSLSLARSKSNTPTPAKPNASSKLSAKTTPDTKLRRRRPTVLSLLGLGQTQDSPAIENEAIADSDTFGLDQLTLETTLSCECASRGALWDHSFNDETFSDIEVSALGKVFHLHRVVLNQARLFATVFSGTGGIIPGCSYTLDISNSYLVLENLSELHIPLEAFEICLQDVYTPAHRAESITLETVFPVLVAACYIQTRSLISYCVQYILSTLSVDIISSYICQIDLFFPSTDIDSGRYYKEFRMLRSRVRNTIHPHIESHLYMCVNTLLVSSSIHDGETACGNASASTDERLCTLLADIPFDWFKAVFESRVLCLVDEFSRYKLLKMAAIARYKVETAAQQSTAETSTSKRRNAFFGNFFGTANNAGVSERTTFNDNSSIQSSQLGVPNSLRGSVTSFESSLLETLGKRSSCVNLSASVLARLFNLYALDFSTIANSNATITESLQILDMFESCIVYTHMTFTQLECVKLEQLVPEAVVLTAFWVQAELINLFTTPVEGGVGKPQKSGLATGLGPIRFAVRVEGLYGHVLDRFDEIIKGGKAVVPSVSVKYAGVEYRVLISVETKTGVSGTNVYPRLPKRKSSVFELARSKSLDELRESTCPIITTGNLDASREEVCQLFVAKATLQRNRPHAGSGSGVSNPLAYTIHVFDPSTHKSGKSVAQRPVTHCAFDGTGYVDEFCVPIPCPVTQEVITLGKTVSDTPAYKHSAIGKLKEFRDGFHNRVIQGKRITGLCAGGFKISTKVQFSRCDLWLIVGIDLLDSLT